MKKIFFMIVTFSFLVFFTSKITEADMELTVQETDNWSYVTIYHENESKDDIEQVVVFLHGDGRNTHYQEPEKYLIEDLGKGYGPVQYELNGTLSLPSLTVIICPQAHYEPSNSSAPDFLSRTDDLHEFVEQIRTIYHKAKIVVIGHSNGACATYLYCANYPDDADKWGFISGAKKGHTEISKDICMLVVASLQEINFDYIGYPAISYFQQFYTISLPLSYTPTLLWDNETGNAYAMLNCSHAEVPAIMLEDSFWQWVMQ